MKNLAFTVLLTAVFFGSCAQKKEQREDFKAEHSVEEKRNDAADSTVTSSDAGREENVVQ